MGDLAGSPGDLAGADLPPTSCNKASDCPGADTECATRTCVGGVCGVDRAAEGTVVAAQTVGDCKQVRCDGQGGTTTGNDDNDIADDANPCTTDTCNAGNAVHTPVAANTGCGQGLKCNATGACVGCLAASDCGTPSNSCQVATCSAQGVCGTEAKPDTTACDDGNACTQSDTCQSGACVGANPIVCVASGQVCHVAGTCDPLSGTCSDPAAPDTTPCDDGNACTGTDTCTAGMCAGIAVVCTASDQCHDAGQCDPMTGTCSNPAKLDGAACDDGSGCTAPDTCQAGVCTGAAVVICTASDTCHDVGVCDATTAICSNPVKPDTSPCDDGNPCTIDDTCTTGVCNPSGAAPNNTACTIGANAGYCFEGSCGSLAVPELLYYRFDGNGTSVPNLAASPPAGTATATLMGGTSQGSGGVCNGALIGAGGSSTSNYLNTGWATSLTGMNWTLSFWMLGTPSTTTTIYILGDVNASGFRVFTGGVAGAGNWILRGGITDVLATGGATTTPSMTTFVYDSAAGNIKSYVNGVLNQTVAQAGPSINGSGPFKVGGYSSSNAMTAAMQMDEFRLYNRALSAAEISSLYTTTSACF